MKEDSRGGLGVLHRSQTGNVFPLTAAAIFVLAGLVGGGVDMSRAYMVQNRLQSACDAGALAGRKAVDQNGFDTQAKTQANLYFNTNFDQSEAGTTGTSFTLSTPDGGNTIEGSASTTVDTVIMQLFGMEQIPLTVSCSASMSIGNSDVMMVLDVTGSMNIMLDSTQTRMEALRVAMKSFYDTVAGSASAGNGRVRFGFVPYSTSANVGKLLYDANPNWIVDNWTYQSREPQYRTVTTNSEVTGYEPPVYSTETSIGDTSDGQAYYYDHVRYYSRWSCDNAKPEDTEWQNNGAATTTTTTVINSQDQRVTTTTTSQPQRRIDYGCFRYDWGKYYIYNRYQYRNLNYSEIKTEDPIYSETTETVFDHWEYKAVNYDTSVFKTFAPVTTPTGYEGAAETSTWRGCVQERDTVNADASAFHYDAATGKIVPAAAIDLDIDSAPTSDASTKWRPLWSDISYRRTDYNGYATNNPTSDYGTEAIGVCSTPSQLLTEMTEAEFDAYTDSLNPTGSTYHDIGMIWGARLSSPTGIFAANVNDTPPNNASVSRHLVFMTDGQMDTNWHRQTAYGIEWHDRRITNNGYSNNDERHIARFEALCQAVKAKGIRVWVIAFASELTSYLEGCASPNSAFLANDADQLNEALQEIGKVVGELRVTQ